MKPSGLFLILVSLLVCHQITFAQVSKDAAVQINVTIGTAPASLTLHWPADARATGYSIYRRLKGATAWGSAKKATATSSQYIDTTITIGIAYEYRVVKILKVGTTSITAYGYTESGINIPAVNDQGILILLVDKTFSDSLKTELTRLTEDLRNEGWRVIRHDVGRSDAVSDVKLLVVNDYNVDPVNTKVLFIFGHVPVPYSGFINPDGHPDHFGAWPADVYYAEFNSGDWPDNNTDTTSGRRAANHNIAGDGKFDVSSVSELSSSTDLMIGRVDLFNMPSFKKSEKDLLKQYLEKDHAFRTGTLKAPVRALIEDSFGYFGGEAFASSGWRSLAPLVGIDSIHEFFPQPSPSDSVTWLPVISTQPYLWAYGCGGGWDNGAGGAGSTGEISGRGYKAIFSMLFGSYFGDWGTADNFLRAPLASEYGLTCAWSGRPYWYFHPMGLGEPIGACAKLTQNNMGDYLVSPTGISNWVHVALMGDPTLVLHPYSPPTALSVKSSAPYNTASLSWQPSSDESILGYNIYRATSSNGSYQLITSKPVSGTTFTDIDPLVDTNAYIVRAVKLETTPSGSYYNLSPGTRNWISGMIKNGVTADNSIQDNLQVIQTMSGVEIILQKSYSSNVKLEIYDVSGKSIRTLDDRMLSSGIYRYNWQTSSVGSGVYFVRATGLREPLMTKILVMQ